MPASGQDLRFGLEAAQGTHRGFWTDRWFAWRDHLLANRKFQRWAAGFPLTRKSRKDGRNRCSMCAPASSIRRSCWPACSFVSSKFSPSAADNRRIGAPPCVNAGGDTATAERSGRPSAGPTPQPRTLRAWRSRCGISRQSRDLGDGGAPCDTLCRSARSGVVITRACIRHCLVALLAVCVRRPAGPPRERKRSPNTAH